MNFRTELHITKNQTSISHNDSILMMGSCFSSNIGKLLTKNKFNVSINPFGNSFNPISIHQLFSPLNKHKWMKDKNNIHFNYHLHSDLSSDSKEYKKKYFEIYESLQERLESIDFIFITYGTAWVYELKENNEIVNNCHKQASDNFNKRLLEVNEIVESWNTTLHLLKSQCKQNVQFIFTVSPIRHLGDGFHQNQLSKSTLLLATDKIVKENSNCNYFPAYELMLDDLRDYRFFESNMTHPNETAVYYIWKKFSNYFFSNATIKQNENIERFYKSIHHKPFNVNSKDHQNFLNNLIQKIEEFQSSSKIDFSEEVKTVKRSIAS